MQYGKIGIPDDQLPLIPWAESRAVDYAARLLLAVGTGAWLMAPIITMSFVNSQNLWPVVTSVFVAGFAVVLSFVIWASNQEIVGGAAA